MGGGVYKIYVCKCAHPGNILGRWGERANNRIIMGDYSIECLRIHVCVWGVN